MEEASTDTLDGLFPRKMHPRHFVLLFRGATSSLIHFVPQGVYLISFHKGACLGSGLGVGVGELGGTRRHL